MTGVTLLAPFVLIIIEHTLVSVESIHSQVQLVCYLQQTQSELRAAQISLAQSEHGKENRLKILRKTHQSALSFKQSLIQELQDIVKEKDEYINQLEDRFTGREADIGKAEVWALGAKQIYHLPSTFTYRSWGASLIRRENFCRGGGHTRFYQTMPRKYLHGMRAVLGCML